MSPPGKLHLRYWKLFLPIATFISILMCFIGFTWGVGFMLGYLLHLAVENDLDQISITSSEGRVLRTFGCFGAVYVGYWLPYATLFKHRSLLSHFPGVSTAIRMVYAFWWILVIFYQFSLDFNKLLIFLPIWLGLSTADLIHYILDLRY